MRLFWLFSLLMLLFLGCAQDDQGGNPPKNHPYFPTELVQRDQTLYVFSNNFDRRFLRGSVLSVDLSVVDAALDASELVVGPKAVTSSGFIPSFASGAQITAQKDFLFYVTRDDRTLRKIPLDPAGLINCTSDPVKVGQDCFSQAPVLSLRQSDPYFLRLFEADSSLTGGVIGYLNEPQMTQVNTDGSFLLPKAFEFERFTWNSTLKTADLADSLSFGESLERALTAIVPSSLIRVNSLIGAIKTLGEHHYVLVAHPGSVPVIYLARVSQDELRTGLPAAMTLAFYGLSQNAKISTLGTLALREHGEEIEIFVSSELPGSILKLSMSKTDSVDGSGRLKLSPVATQFACEVPTDLAFSPDNKYLFVACEDGKILTYDPDSLSALYRDPDSGAAFGRGTIKLHFDTRFLVEPFRLYTSNFNDGSIGIFQFTSAIQAPLSRLGHIFQPAPLNRLGGSK